ncbi:MAG TPA: hypothetical protein VEJ63_01050 [Planctomycetota bacterium]|nr:hypothetical protein [Planctomycetota bacterium]
MSDPYGHLGEEAFNRLPESVKAEMREKHARKAAASAAFQERKKTRALYCALIGGFVSLLIAYTIVTLPLIIAFGILGAACGAIIVAKELSHIGGIILMGLMGSLGCCIAYGLGWMQNQYSGIAMIFGWIFWAVSGGVIAKIAETDRQKETF